MSVLDGFYTTWNNARETFGQGTPQPGTDFDNSSKLRDLGSNVDNAKPAGWWSGAAASGYEKANDDHKQVFGKLAELDQKLAEKVNQSAQVVENGRQNLDAVKQWVTDAANSLPPGKQRDMFLMQIANKGLSQLTDVVKQSNDELTGVGNGIRGLKGGYDDAGDQKHAKGEGETQALGSEEQKKAEEDARKRAEKDVRDALAGDKDAAGRVEAALDGITPGQPLSPEQGSYLSQMQAQQAGMSVNDLKTAEERLGDHNDIFGDSWQLMSNTKVDFPKTDTQVGALDDPTERVHGGFDQLPQSVRDTLNAPDIQGAGNLQTIAGIVEHGDDKFQTNTEIDRNMLKKAAVMMDTPFWEQSAEEYDIPADQRPKWLDPTVSAAFNAVSPDHQAIHDALSASNADGHIGGIDADKFMKGTTERIWADGGDAAGKLFEWTNNTSGPEARIAAETANVYAGYLGEKGPHLLDLPGHNQIGDINPELVKSFATGLQPYQIEMVEEDPLVDTAFNRLDTDLGGKLEHTKNLFAVIDSQPDAAREFNRAAYQSALDMQGSFAELAHERPDLKGFDHRLDDLQSSARLLGVIDGGMHQETMSNIENGKLNQADALATAQQAYEFKKDILRSITSYGPGGDLLTNTAADIIAGPEPDPNNFKYNPDGSVSNIGLSATEQSVQHQITQAQYTVASQFIQSSSPYIDPAFFNADGSLKAPGQIPSDDWSKYDAQLTAAMAEYTQVNAMLSKFGATFEHIGGLQQ